MEKVEGTPIGRGVVDAQELSGIARAVKSLSVEVNTFVSARDDEFHRQGLPIISDGESEYGRANCISWYLLCLPSFQRIQGETRNTKKSGKLARPDRYEVGIW